MRKFLNSLVVVVLGVTILAVAAMPVPAAGAAPAQQGGLQLPVTGTIPGGTFEGVLSITNFALQNGQLVVSGVLEGTATVGGVVTEITQTFTNLPLSLLNPVGGRCDILLLDIPGGITLDVLGLVVDLAPVELDVYAQSGPGNLLGNLLCAVAGLLDGNGPLQGIQRLLDQINNLL